MQFASPNCRETIFLKNLARQITLTINNQALPVVKPLANTPWLQRWTCQKIVCVRVTNQKKYRAPNSQTSPNWRRVQKEKVPAIPARLTSMHVSLKVKQ